MSTILMFSGSSVDIAMFPDDQVFPDVLFPSSFVSSDSGEDVPSEICSWFSMST